MSLRLSEVFSVEQRVASLEDNIACVAKFVLLANVAHIEELFIVLNKESARSVKVGHEEDGSKGPYHEFFNHVHAQDA